MQTNFPVKTLYFDVYMIFFLRTTSPGLRDRGDDVGLIIARAFRLNGGTVDGEQPNEFGDATAVTLVVHLPEARPIGRCGVAGRRAREIFSRATHDF